jgi:hypothetical protein
VDKDTGAINLCKVERAPVFKEGEVEQSVIDTKIII